MTHFDSRPTVVRFYVVGITALAAMWLYIDRVCFSTLAPNIGTELGISEKDMAFVLGTFFFTYAIFQIPIGSLADRYGPRVILTASILAWSLCTAATSLTASVWGLLAVRLALGACEAGAYPAAAGMIRKWASAGERGLLSSIVAFGGRIGGAIAPFLTAFAALNWLGNPQTDAANWRGVFLVYGVAGIIVAVLFWIVVRDMPSGHPWANAAEAARVPDVGGPPSTTSRWQDRLLALASSRNMWLFGATQFCVNVGWAFLITNLPAYLKGRFGVNLKDTGFMQSVPLIASCVGMAFGGFFADAMYRALGRRWGRSAPIVGILTLCASCYFIATQLSTAWAVVATLAVMAFLVDLTVPCIWAFAQDVGGKQVGAALGWGNMWGNFGAMASPITLYYVKEAFSWETAFMLCGVLFGLGAFAAFNLNAMIPVGSTVNPSDAQDYRELDDGGDTPRTGG